jgi:hypothetical protein
MGAKRAIRVAGSQAAKEAGEKKAPKKSAKPPSPSPPPPASATAASTASSTSALPSQTELQAAQDEYDAITDKIPVKPVGVAEGTSYGLVILAALAVALGSAYAVASELLFEPKEMTVYAKALARVQADKRVQLRLGTLCTPCCSCAATPKSSNQTGELHAVIRFQLTRV